MFIFEHPHLPRRTERIRGEDRAALIVVDQGDIDPGILLEQPLVVAPLAIVVRQTDQQASTGRRCCCR